MSCREASLLFSPGDTLLCKQSNKILVVFLVNDSCNIKIREERIFSAQDEIETPMDTKAFL